MVEHGKMFLDINDYASEEDRILLSPNKILVTCGYNESPTCLHAAGPRRWTTNQATQSHTEFSLSQKGACKPR